MFSANVFVIYGIYIAQANNEVIAYCKGSASAVVQKFRKKRCGCSTIEGVTNEIKTRNRTCLPNKKDMLRRALAALYKEQKGKI